MVAVAEPEVSLRSSGLKRVGRVDVEEEAEGGDIRRFGDLGVKLHL